MLQLQTLREHKEEIIIAMNKRNIDATSMVSEVLEWDEKRRSLQTQMDQTLAESNKLSREIGELYKSGKAQQANALKEKTSALKEASKRLGEELEIAAEKLQQALYTIPNVPHDSVPAGTSAEDNEEVYR